MSNKLHFIAEGTTVQPQSRQRTLKADIACRSSFTRASKICKATKKQLLKILFKCLQSTGVNSGLKDLSHHIADIHISIVNCATALEQCRYVGQEGNLSDPSNQVSQSNNNERRKEQRNCTAYIKLQLEPRSGSLMTELVKRRCLSPNQTPTPSTKPNQGSPF
nr:hypothetical transcript [Hymenolepis microstoma]